MDGMTLWEIFTSFVGGAAFLFIVVGGFIAINRWICTAQGYEPTPPRAGKRPANIPKVYKGPRGIMEAAAVAEQHRSGRQLWQVGTVILTDSDMADYGTAVHTEWMLRNREQIASLGLHIDNRLSADPREVHKRQNREAHDTRAEERRERMR